MGWWLLSVVLMRAGVDRTNRLFINLYMNG